MPRRLAPRDEQGFTLLGLMVVVALINIGLAVAVTSWVTIDKRAQEAELIFRGQQYVRALRCHQQQEGGLPEDLDELLETDCIRALYPDPMSSSGEWRVIRESDLEELAVAGDPFGGGNAARGRSLFDDQVSGAISGVLNERLAAINRELLFSEDVRTAGEAGAESGRGVRTEGLRAAFDRMRTVRRAAVSISPEGVASVRLRNLTVRLRQEFGSGGNGIVGVASSSTDASLRLYEGETTYDKWRFLAR